VAFKRAVFLAVQGRCFLNLIQLALCVACRVLQLLWNLTCDVAFKRAATATAHKLRRTSPHCAVFIALLCSAARVASVGSES
jgi:hypothetical protein